MIETHLAIAKFLNYLQLDRGVSQHTLSAYESDLNQFVLFNENRKILVSDLDAPAFRTYFQTLHAKGVRPASQARKLSALKQWLKFCLSEGWITQNPIEEILSPKPEAQLPKALGLEDLERLLVCAQTGLDYQGSEGRGEALRARDRAMIYLLYATGLRVSELLSLSPENVNLTERTVRVLGKRAKERIIPFAPAAAEHLAAYWLNFRDRLNPRCQELFLNPRGKALSRQGFWEILNKIAVKAELQAALSPHVLRHTFATHLLQGGISLRSLQLLLGHSDLGSTQIYTSIAPEHLSSAMRRHHPRAE